MHLSCIWQKQHVFSDSHEAIHTPHPSGSLELSDAECEWSLSGVHLLASVELACRMHTWKDHEINVHNTSRKRMSYHALRPWASASIPLTGLVHMTTPRMDFCCTQRNCKSSGDHLHNQTMKRYNFNTQNSTFTYAWFHIHIWSIPLQLTWYEFGNFDRSHQNWWGHYEYCHQATALPAPYFPNVWYEVLYAIL